MKTTKMAGIVRNIIVVDEILSSSSSDEEEINYYLNYIENNNYRPTSRIKNFTNILHTSNDQEVSRFLVRLGFDDFR